ncbi:G2-specific protein kinase nim-1 [Taphrina deformans PYCC 5710]|uniref:non-specific serine/threonine protein kinase n=1 Tax=Taphrina deformans (strain PYCC 5710 / ATCC 11124 / CBS 356.35 / IMI 108563 / JCM 9778 / NBRC 8474) TaxID=1097556 RepID=R4XCU2_TAPDE|nr:G2-specific protein kinase nim-1 [Taphrina deformans PYCC 5710]|eukprot:CCG81140.1 G2-specific protein kinase nim-1 [Taphrina deformans PYCC 5710]
MWRKMKPREQEQLAAEIRILRDLQHKNIVRYISETVDHETKMVYIYMEYCGNGDLYELIQSRKESSPVVRFSEHTVWQIFTQLAMALFRCHNGVDPPPLEDITNSATLGTAQIPQAKTGNIVLHRDIKPHNVFLDHNNRVKLGDFGLSKELRGQNLAETFVGTPFYMSPEIIAGRAYNAKSDIWALGCVIYEMCAFDPPFLARDQHELNRKIKVGAVSSIVRYGYSEVLNSTIQTCLRQDEKMRPSAAGLLRRPEMVMARQQLHYFDREELLLEKETRLVAHSEKRV